MIPRSRGAALAALALAAAAHGGVLLVQAAQPRIEIEGGAAGEMAVPGNSFADMSAGILSPEVANEAVSEPVSDTTPPVSSARLAPTAPTAKPLTSHAAQVSQPARVAPTVQAPSDVPVLQAARPVEQAAMTEAAAPAPMEPEVERPDEEAAEDAPTERAPTQAARPPERPPRVEVARPAPTKTQAEPPKRAAASAQGNSDTNARAGVATGRAEATANASGAAEGRTSRQGNAAASNYPGKVFSRINRVRRSATNARGETVVAFAIGANGALASISIARSSGSPSLDEAALAQVRRAAPFPPPPQGARRAYTVKISGR
ncbi:TonB family protein [Tropicimonas sediminicola]|uniref:Outer membrane transport energization protein TonB n=1 Tax=Tropicimonas sediminicola TaxID=1031541 RepID=A0A239LCB2_9RHOB|nr:TonB family protein [Tropicimonas sediminicola]SNT27602.1 outer membrane transport energization protein TonB [Tropicimonas sediminicola]